jgi:hypothetical protein
VYRAGAIVAMACNVDTVARDTSPITTSLREEENGGEQFVCPVSQIQFAIDLRHTRRVGRLD